MLTACLCVIAICTSCGKPVSSTADSGAEAGENGTSEEASNADGQAIAFKTVNEDGDEIDLKKHLGKDVIMLDFWATWCAPCIMAMPEVTEIAKKYKDRGLVFYAVNEGEDPDTVKQFLAQHNLDIPVAMDFDGKIHRSFNGEGLPHTVVIGKDGRVQVDHLGYWKGFAAQLDEEVEKLLDDK